MSQWQPIETAPLNPVGKANGPFVLVFSKYNHGVYQARWVAKGESGEWEPKAKSVEYPVLNKSSVTHWMPLPPPP